MGARLPGPRGRALQELNLLELLARGGRALRWYDECLHLPIPCPHPVELKAVRPGWRYWLP